MSRSKPLSRFISRFVASALLVAGFLFFPWGVTAIGILVSIAVFHWYLEALALGFFFAVIAGFSAWKAVLAFGGAILAAEALKSRFEPRQWFSYLPFAMVAAIAFIALFFLVL